MTSFTVTAGAGTLRGDAETGLVLPHAWTAEGVVADAGATGAHIAEIPRAVRAGADVRRVPA